MNSRNAYLGFLTIHRKTNFEETLNSLTSLEDGLSKVGLGNIYGINKIISSINKIQESIEKDKIQFLQCVTEPEWAYAWARDIGDVEYMRQFVNTSSIAPYWAAYIGDIEHMKQFVTDRNDITHWNRLFPDNQIEMPSK